MPRSRQETHRRILDAAYSLFHAQGFSRVNVDEVAARAGITKRTLYDHIRSKDDLLAEVLEHQSSIALQHTTNWSARSKKDPEGFILALFEDFARWTTKGGFSGLGFSRVVMELADLPGHPARKVASRHKAALEKWLADELGSRGVKEAGVMAQQVLMLIEGATLLTVTHGDRTYIRAASEAARVLLMRSIGAFSVRGTALR